MKSVVQVGLSRKTIFGAAGAVISLLAPQALGVVTFEFRDLIADGNPNGVENVPAGSDFSFEVVVHATAGERLSGLSFKLVFEEWGNAALGLTDQAFTVASEPSRTGSFFDFVTAPSVKDERLDPENASDLGAENTGFGSTTGTDLFVAQLSLRVDASMPSGTYTIAPNSGFLGWYNYEGDPTIQPFDNTIPYTVGVVVPEPSTYALMGACGLLGFGLYRRLRS